MKTALVISTYNNAHALGLCLKSLTNQTETGFDILVADDGSTEETKAKLDFFRPLFKTNIEHVWHPDTGYNKAKINNEAFRKLQDYSVIICIDGDTIVHYKFIEDHLSFHENQSRLLFMGRRVDLGPEMTGKLSEDNVCSFNRGLTGQLLVSGLKKDSVNILRAVRINVPLFRKLLKRDRVYDLLGSNYSVSAQLMFEVNGYDEDFKSYWGEDGDLFIRLRNAGAELFGSKSIALQYHLFHERREPTKEHIERYQKLSSDRSYKRCVNGIAKVTHPA